VSRIHRLLVANRGEIARRVFRSCRELGIRSIAVFSEPDRGEPFVREADEAVPLGGATPAESYLRIEALLDAAARTQADAVHPGYGFLAESAEFARRCVEAGLVFVGPSPEVIASMGSKIEAKRRMEKAGVPVIPSAELASGSSAAEAARGLGYPLLVKASAGGGGKGMRVVREPSALEGALESARREAATAFGDDTLFLERYLEAPRHVEIQIFGDQSGRVVHLYERECSIQRRHQKILEESPSVALDAGLRASMGAAAVSAGEALGYVGAGTVEFLLDAEGAFYFLEVNTRLQVEHPVTERITGLDLVALQLDVAEGGRVPAQGEIPVARGHAIEARLYAEDPQHAFLPSTGTIHRFEVPQDEDVRVDAGVETGSEVGIHYDPLLAKLTAHAPTREAAARRLASTLERSRVHGPRTNRDLLVRILRHTEFLEGRTDTHFLERHDPAELGRPLAGAEAERVHAVVAALAAQAQRRVAAPVLGSLPSGWRNNPSALQEVAFEGPGGRLEIGYRFEDKGFDSGTATVRVGAEEPRSLRVGRCTPERVDLEWEGVQRSYEVHRIGGQHFVDSWLGATMLRELERFPLAEVVTDPGSLTAPMPGLVRVVRVQEGEVVREGDVLLVLEAMKMEHEVVAGTAGRVTQLFAREGDQVDAEQVLVVIEEDAGAGAG
jgi:acetyl/propionyl-CoA carboxylase alpha subunit